MTYKITLKRWHDEHDTYWMAEMPELQGAATHGDTIKEALNNIREVAATILEIKREHGDPIPVPASEKEVIEMLGDFTDEERAECYAAVDKFHELLANMEAEKNEKQIKRIK